MSDIKDFSKFSSSFQEKLASIMYRERSFCDQISEVMDINYFESKHLQVFIKLMLDYKIKYSTHPGKTIMENEVRDKISEESEVTQSRIRGFFARVISDEKEDEDEYVKDEALTFCRRQKIKEGFVKAAQKLKSDGELESVKDILDEAFKLGSVNSSGYEYMKDFEKRFERKSRNPVSTGWQEVDRITSGGLGSGELGVVVAPTGAGKSMALVHLGAKALLNGLNVVYYTLELGDTVVAHRFDSVITGFALKSLFELKDDVYEKLTSTSLGNLIIKEYPTKTATVQTIRNHLESLKSREDFGVDLVLVDYGDLLKPSSQMKEKRNELEEIYETLRGTAMMYGCPVWTASQTNRGALNAEVITMESISEAFNKCFPADFIVSISRTPEDKQNNTGLMFIAKNRNGPDGFVLPMVIDTTKVHMEVQKNNGETIASVEEQSDRKKAKALADKWKSLKDKI